MTANQFKLNLKKQFIAQYELNDKKYPFCPPLIAPNFLAYVLVSFCHVLFFAFVCIQFNCVILTK